MDSVYDWVSRVTRSKREYGAFTRAQEFDVDLDVLARCNAENAAAQEEAEFEDAPEHHVAVCESPAASTSNTTSHRPFPFTFPCNSEPLSDPLAPASPLKRKQGPSDPAAGLSRKAREALRSKRRRKESRKAERLNSKAASGSSQHVIVGVRVKATPRVQIDGFEVATNTEAISDPGYTCLPDTTLNTRRVKEAKCKKRRVELLPEQREYTLKELVEEHGFKEEDWNGKRRQFAILCGQPGRQANDGENSEWQTKVVEPLNACFEEAAAALSQADREMEKPKEERQDVPFARKFLDVSSHAKRTLIENRRGTHRAETIGVGMGMGRDRLKQFLHSVLCNAVFMHLTAQTPLRRLVGFANRVPPFPFTPTSWHNLNWRGGMYRRAKYEGVHRGRRMREYRWMRKAKLRSSGGSLIRYHHYQTRRRRCLTAVATFGPDRHGRPADPPKTPTPPPPEEDLLAGPKFIEAVSHGWTRSFILDGHMKEVQDKAHPGFVVISTDAKKSLRSKMGDAAKSVLADKLMSPDEYDVPWTTCFSHCVIITGLAPDVVKSLANTSTSTLLESGEPATGYFLPTNPPRTNFTHLFVDVPKLPDMAAFLEAVYKKLLALPAAKMLFDKDHSRVPDPDATHPMDFKQALDVLFYFARADQITFTPRQKKATGSIATSILGTRLYLFPFSLDNAENIEAFYALFTHATFCFRVGHSGMARPWWGPFPKFPKAMSCWECLSVDHYTENCPITHSPAHLVTHKLNGNKPGCAPALLITAIALTPYSSDRKTPGGRDQRGKGFTAHKRAPY
ncbi:hypothetical protein C8F01DRAFT_1090622 [Mycena amicta]|nr:hypothetical protein C8F01DRAFT_1090622 [Mycena amicta]